MALLGLLWRLVNNPAARALLDLSAFWGQVLAETWTQPPVGFPAVDEAELLCPACGQPISPGAARFAPAGDAARGARGGPR